MRVSGNGLLTVSQVLFSILMIRLILHSFLSAGFLLLVTSFTIKIKILK